MILSVSSKSSRSTSTVALLLLSCTAVVFGQTPPPGEGVGNGTMTPLELPPVVMEEIARCGSPFDAHLHLEAQWFTPDNAQPLLTEMTASGIEQGVIMAVYGPIDALGVDPNEGVASFIEQSNGRLFGLASLSTTHPDWESVKEEESNRLRTFLEMDGFVAVKLAPPHTRLPMNSTIMGDIIQTVSESSKPIIAIHIGTTPFCGPFGDFVLGQRGLCTREYVDPYYLEDFLAANQNVTFVMMHGGQDFDDGTSGDVPFYDGELFDHTLELMTEYDNIVLEISAMLATNPPPDTSYRNPLAYENLAKVVEADMQSRTIYGSDANQFPGGTLSYLTSTIQSLIAVGLTDEERCAILVDFPKQVYGIPIIGGSPEPSTQMPSGAVATSAPSPDPSSNGIHIRISKSTSVTLTLATIVLSKIF